MASAYEANELNTSTSGGLKENMRDAVQKVSQKMKQPPEEGRTTKSIEQVTAKIPSLGYMSLAIGSMAISAALAAANKKQMANFVGLWAPSLLIIGLYNKLVKVENELKGLHPLQGQNLPQHA